MTLEIGPEAVPYRASGVSERAIDEEVLVYFAKDREALNSSARAIWDLCDGRCTVNDICVELGRRFSVAPSAFLADVTSVVADLVAARVLLLGTAIAIDRLATREQIPELLTRLGLTGWGVELGVRHGAYSTSLLARSRLSLVFSIDSWSRRGYGTKDYLTAVNTLCRFGVRSAVLRMSFSDAARLFGDETLDFVYLDGFADENPDQICEQIRLWWNKTRSGGIVAGHDYCDAWPKVVEGVDAFATRENIEIHTTAERHAKGSGPYRSWLARKSGAGRRSS